MPVGAAGVGCPWPAGDAQPGLWPAVRVTGRARGAAVDGSGLVYVQEGTLDRLDEWFPPQAEVLTWTRQPWMRSLDLQQFDHGPS